MLEKYYRKLVGVGVLWLVLPIGAFTQSANSSVSGRVLDQNSAVIRGATITLQRPGSTQKRMVTADDAGRFRFDHLPPGEYRLGATLLTFSTFEKAISLAGSENIMLEIVLKPRPIAETVVVTSSHLATP